VERDAGLLAVVLAALAVAGCGGGDEDASPPPEPPDALVAMGLHDLGLAKSIELSERPARPVERRLEFGCGDALDQMVRSGDRLVFCGYESSSYSIDPDLEGKPARIGRGYFMPEQDGIVWLIYGRKVKRVTLEGEVLARGTVPCIPIAVTEAGGICQGRGQRTVKVTDIETGRLIHRLPGVFASSNANTVAACREPCPALHLSDATTGESRAIRPPDPLRFSPTYDAQFSPDETLLATEVYPEPAKPEKRFPQKNRSTSVALVDLKSDEATLIPDSELGGYGRIAWSDDGERLYFSARDGAINVYDLETEQTTKVPFDLKDTIFQLAAF